MDREEIIYLVLLDLAEEETDHFLLPQEVLWRQLVRGGVLCCSRVESKVYNITGGGYQETIRLTEVGRNTSKCLQIVIQKRLNLTSRFVSR